MKTGFKLATHIWSYHLLMVLIGVVFISGMSGTWYGLLVNAVLVLGMIAMALNEGAYHGEKACTLAVSLEKQVKEGRGIDEGLKEQVFKRKVAAWILIFGSLPFLLISTINVIAAPFYPEITVEDMKETEETGSFAFQYEEEAEEGTAVNTVNVVARLVFMPFVSVYTMVDGSVLNALFFLFSLLTPGAEAIGYLCGPKLRDKKLKDIARGKKRKMRNLKVHKKPRQQKAEV